MNVSIRKLVSVTTDGAAATTNEHVGVIGLCRNNFVLPGTFSYHCAIDQQALYTKLIDFQQHVVIGVQAIVNSIRARPLHHRLFKHLLDEINGIMEI
jgi:hypothetical protein